MTQILPKDEKILRAIAKPVKVADIGTAKFNAILKDMKEALNSQDDGVAIAAPQIGVSLRIFIVSGKILDRTDTEESEKESKKEHPDLVFINPKITKLSRKKNALEEGCLSVRYLYGKVSRSEKATVEALDEKGKKFIRGASGLLAQIFQHETDHLDGVLFTDKAKELREILPKKSHE